MKFYKGLLFFILVPISMIYYIMKKLIELPQDVLNRSQMIWGKLHAEL